MTYYTKSNFISTAISTDFAQGATAIPCTSLSGLTGVIKMIISPTDSSRREIVIGTVSGNSLISCTRGVEGTTDQAHSEGEIIEMTLTAADLNDINTAIGLKVLGDAGGTVDNTLMRWDGVGGYTAQDSAVTLTDLGVLYPSTTDVGALGTITNMWGDLFLASGGVINFDNGDVTLTHAANSLTLAGGVLTIPTSGLTINTTNVTATGTQLNYLNAVTGTTGTATTNLVFSTSPTLVTPTLGTATATSINKVTITAPTTSATLTLADGSSLITVGGYSTTLTTTGITNVTLPTSGTLVTNAVTTLSSLVSIGTITTGVWNGTDIAVADGGTGRSTSTTAYGLIAAGTTATGALQTLAAGATTQILVGGGASALPAWGTDLPTAVTIGGAYVTRVGGTDVTPADGGTGVSNGANNTITFTGNYTLGLTLTGNTAVTLPTSGTISTLAETETLTNKKITKRTGTTTSSATPTINTDNVDFYSLTAQAVDITSFTTNLSGTPTENQTLWIAITGTAARAITWGTSFESSTVNLPTTTVLTNRLDVGFAWNTVSSKWRCIATC